MSYRVLARAYRSGTFDEVIGQEAVATTLKNAIKSGRVHHGYLFTGTRGVGKTSVARILAKALNCLAYDAPTTTPCGKCESCRLVATGEDLDVVEIDAASNTGVDNIRELRGNATLRPARSRFKVYIIDEVHMLSTGAFNALLKTLEEPPPHVKFILATTESQKVPATIQSRCQRFDFRAIDVNSIAKHLAAIAQAEKIRVDEPVLRRVARLANGSMRDALSILDQLLSYESEHLTAEIVDQIIPPPHDELALAVVDRVAENDAAGALLALDRALQTGRTVERFCDHLIEHLRTLMLMRACGPETDLVDLAGSMRDQLARQAEKFDAPTYVYMIALLEELRRNSKFSGAARALADAAVVRLAMSRQFTDIGAWLDRLGSGGVIAPPTTESAGDIKKNGARSVAIVINADRPADGAVRAPTATPPPPAPVQKSVPPSSPVYARDAPDVLPGIDPPRQSAISSEQWQRIARDPWIQRVKDAVEGTLMDVRPARAVVQSTAIDAPAVGESDFENNGEGSTASSPQE